MRPGMGMLKRHPEYSIRLIFWRKFSFRTL